RQAVVVAIDAKRRPTNPAVPEAVAWDVFVRGGCEATPLAAVEWAARAAALGAGELLVTSIDRDGTRSVYDTDLLRAISSAVTVPVVASGGAASPADF